MEVIDYLDGRPTEGLRKLQVMQKDMLRDILAYAQDIGVQCFLVAGSALGSIRHGDIIPWDDDVDIGMLRADYERLLDAWEERPLAGYFLQSERSDPTYPLSFAKLRKDGTVFEDEHFRAGSRHSGVFIDIFPYDRVDGTMPDLVSRSRILHVLDYVLLARTFSHGSHSTDRRIIFGRKVLRLLDPLIPVALLKRVRRRLMTADGIAGPDAGRVCSFPMYNPKKFAKTLVAVEAIMPTRPGPFGDLTVPLPNECETFLTTTFGDFMRLPPVEQRRPPHASSVDFGSN